MEWSCSVLFVVMSAACHECMGIMVKTKGSLSFYLEAVPKKIN